MRVPGLAHVEAVTLGSQHTCALDAAGAVHCWGYQTTREPSLVRGLPPVVEVAAGRNATCARTSSRDVFCWGDAFHGELGPPGGADGDRPERIPDLPPVAQVSVGFQHVCIVDDRSRAWCWGNDDWGGVGRRATASSEDWRPIVVEAAGQVRQIDAGYRHTCAVSPGGEVRCWGGVGSSGETFVVPGIAPMTRVASGDENACGLDREGAVTCWTLDQGRPTEPARVALPAPAAEVAVSAAHACARLPRQGVYCWGANRDGELGNGSTADSATPVRVRLP